jgi:hypothetical protein
VLAVQGLVVLMLGLGADRLGSATLGRAEAFAKECSGAAIEMVTLWISKGGFKDTGHTATICGRCPPTYGCMLLFSSL